MILRTFTLFFAAGLLLTPPETIFGLILRQNPLEIQDRPSRGRGGKFQPDFPYRQIFSIFQKSFFGDISATTWSWGLILRRVRGYAQLNQFVSFFDLEHL